VRHTPVMRVRVIAALTVVGVVALPALAGATSQLAAMNVRIGNHAAFVRVVVDFNGTVPVNQVEFDHLWTLRAALHVARPGITTWTSGSTGQGVRVALQPATQALNIGMGFAPRRFKYVSYAIVTGKRLAIDLWKSTPPPGGGVGFGYRNCLQISSAHVSKGTVSVSGIERGVFEHMFRVVVRGANGRVLGRRAVSHTGSWSTTVRYRAGHRQPGTLEAVSLSPKDGSLACFYEQRVTLPAS
jgi:hypothetical protein